MNYIVLYVKGGRFGSRPLTDKPTLESLVHYTLLQRDPSGAEHWDVIGIRKKNRKSRCKG